MMQDTQKLKRFSFDFIDEIARIIWDKPYKKKWFIVNTNSDETLTLKVVKLIKKSEYKKHTGESRQYNDDYKLAGTIIVNCRENGKTYRFEFFYSGDDEENCSWQGDETCTFEIVK